MKLNELRIEIKKNANPEKAIVLQRFFKTGPGQYGEGDIFYGIMVPVQRSLAKRYIDLSMNEIQKLLDSPVHEERLIGLMILVELVRKGDAKTKEIIFNFYHLNRRNINNWDLVDLTADRISGAYLFDKDKSLLFELAKSDNLWDRRIAIMSTFHFIKNHSFDVALSIIPPFIFVSKLFINH